MTNLAISISLQIGLNSSKLSNCQTILTTFLRSNVYLKILFIIRSKSKNFPNICSAQAAWEVSIWHKKKVRTFTKMFVNFATTIALVTTIVAIKKSLEKVKFYQNLTQNNKRSLTIPKMKKTTILTNVVKLLVANASTTITWGGITSKKTICTTFGRLETLALMTSQNRKL